MAHRILIADDEPSVATELESRLVALGYDVAAIASSARAAIDLTEQTAPHAVLLDVALGDMDSIEAGRVIRRRAGIPILFTVADADREGLLRIRASNQGTHLLKPFADRDLRVGLALALDPSAAADELEDRFFDVSLDMLCCLGFDGHFRRLNPAWERTLGFTREELMARPFIEFVHPDDRERTLNQNRAVRAGGQAQAFENRYRCKDGSYRWLVWNAAPDLSRRTIYSMARDFTEQKRAVEEREALVAELQKALAEVKTLRDILPTCSYCTRIRDEDDNWQSVEVYVSTHTNARFSHGVCPTCYQEIVSRMNGEPEPG
ncbi:MAG: PAS domain S-box protein [Myxococcota bacterium]